MAMAFHTQEVNWRGLQSKITCLDATESHILELFLLLVCILIDFKNSSSSSCGVVYSGVDKNQVCVWTDGSSALVLMVILLYVAASAL